MSKKWITPFKKQCFVTAGVSLNLASHGMVMGFPTILLPQLRLPGSTIPIDDHSGSWIASIVGFALIAGNFIVPSIMSKYGRKIANIVSLVLMMCGWLLIITADSIPKLLIARFLQGSSMGMGSSLGPVLIGEYTSPKNRGAFIMTASLATACGGLLVHSMGSYLIWQKTALIVVCLVFLDLLIVLYSPESPSWLADQGRIEASKKVFRWLRGDEENEELGRMIKTSLEIRKLRLEFDKTESFTKRLKRNMSYLNVTLRRREFYKPIFIMIHVYTLGQWAGANALVSYTADVFKSLLGQDANVPILVITLDMQRIISNSCGIFIIRKIRRRVVLLITVGINLFALLSTAAYSYLRKHGGLPFDSPVIGIFLTHLHMFSIAIGTVPLPIILAGELFPLEFRSVAGAISMLFLSANLFLTVKTFPILNTAILLHGVYVLYATVVSYCLVIAFFFLPETKDRTLQEIEDEFRGRPLSPEELKSVQSLHSMRMYSCDRRCSNPML